MDLIQKVYTSLAADPAIFNLLADKEKGIWADLTNYSGAYPVIAYTVVSDTPVIFGDDRELGRRVMVQISIITRDGNDAEIVRAVNNRMDVIDWTRYSTERFTDGQDRVTAVRFVILDTESEGYTNE